MTDMRRVILVWGKISWVGLAFGRLAAGVASNEPSRVCSLKWISHIFAALA